MAIAIEVGFQLRAVPLLRRMTGSCHKSINEPDAALLAVKRRPPSKDRQNFQLAIAGCRKAVSEPASAELVREIHG